MLANEDLDGGTWQAHGVHARQVLEKVALIEDGSPALGDFARELVESAVRQGFLSSGR
jgi:putative hydrolase of HD superfamily